MKANKNKAYNSLIDDTLRYIVPIALIVIAAAFIAYGINDGEMSVVFRKAIALCRECVGIG